jgi:hypothetical protein
MIDSRIMMIGMVLELLNLRMDLYISKKYRESLKLKGHIEWKLVLNFDWMFFFCVCNFMYICFLRSTVPLVLNYECYTLCNRLQVFIVTFFITPFRGYSTSTVCKNIIKFFKLHGYSTFLIIWKKYIYIKKMMYYII